MEKENLNIGSGQRSGPPDDTANNIAGVSDDASKPEGSHNPDSGRAQKWPEPTVLTLQDLIDLPKQILPEQTYTHLKNAGREALLAVISLANSLNNSRTRSGSRGDGKTRRRINVE